MTAKHPGDCRIAGELPERWFRIYARSLKHGAPAAFAHAIQEWRREIARANVTKPDGGLFVGKGK